MNNKPNLFALEAISFQHENFVESMADVFRPFMGRSRALSREDQRDLRDALHALTLKRFGIDAEYIFSFDGAYIALPDLKPGHPFFAQWAEYFEGEDGLRLIRRAKGAAKGLVDLSKAKVSGAFSDLHPTINVDMSMMMGRRYTPQEVAAVCLHEIGHFFTTCEMLCHVVTTNIVMAGLDKVARGSDPKEIEMAIVAAGKELDVEKTVVENLKNSTDIRSAVTVLITTSCKEVRSEYGVPLYDYNGCEMMADQFATRMGAGTYLMTALDKIYQDYGVTWSTSRMSWVLSSICELLMVVMIAMVPAAYTFVLFGGAIAPALIVGGIVFILLFIAFAASGGVSYGRMLYETEEVRCLRVRRQLIELAKDPKVTAGAAKIILSDCEYLKNMASRYKNNESIWGPIGRALFAAVRREFKSIELQRALEKLALNDLFLKSLELKHG